MSLCFLSLESGKVFNKVILERLQKKGFEGLSEALIVLFPYIDQAQNISISELSRQVGYSRQAMHKNIKKLEELGYITLSLENQKEKTVHFTSKSKQLMIEANKIIQEIEAELSSLLGGKELETYKIHQGKIYNYLSLL